MIGNCIMIEEDGYRPLLHYSCLLLSHQVFKTYCMV